MIHSKYETEVSYQYRSDLVQQENTVFNKWIGRDLKIYSEVLSNGEMRYETTFIDDGVYYRFTADIDEEEFIKIIENLTY